jgi:hypothetical protein
MRCPIPEFAAKEFPKFVEREGPGRLDMIWNRFLREVGADLAKREEWDSRVAEYDLHNFLEDFCPELVYDKHSDLLNHERNEYEQAKRNKGKAVFAAGDDWKPQLVQPPPAVRAPPGLIPDEEIRRSSPAPVVEKKKKADLPPDAVEAIAYAIKQQAMMEKARGSNAVKLASSQPNPPRVLLQNSSYAFPLKKSPPSPTSSDASSYFSDDPQAASPVSKKRLHEVTRDVGEVNLNQDLHREVADLKQVVEMLRFLIEGQNVKISELEHAVRMMVTRKR